MGKKLFLLLIIAWFLLIGCTSQQLRKEATTDKLGTFKFDERKNIYEILDEIANRLKASRYYVVLKKKEIRIDDKVLVLDLIDRNGDGKPNNLCFTPTRKTLASCSI